MPSGFATRGQSGSGDVFFADEQETPMKPSLKITVRHIMTRNPHTLEVDDVLDLADDLMTMARIRHIPILERGKVVGVLSQRDLFFSALVKAMGLDQRAKGFDENDSGAGSDEPPRHYNRTRRQRQRGGPFDGG